MTDPLEAITEIAEDVDSLDPQTLEQTAAEELESLWHDLLRARDYAYNGVWSMDCESRVTRIMKLTLASGKPTPWGSVPTPLVLNGWYELIHDLIGFDVQLSVRDRHLAQDHWDRIQESARRYAR